MNEDNMREFVDSFDNSRQRICEERPVPNDILSVDTGLSCVSVSNGKMSVTNIFNGKERGFAGEALVAWGEGGFSTAIEDGAITFGEISRKGEDMLESMHGIMDEIEEIEKAMREYGALTICRMYREKMTALYSSKMSDRVVYVQMAIIGLI